MSIWIGIVVDFFMNLMLFYVPFIYLMKPRKGSRYVNLVVVTVLFNTWIILWHFVLTPSNTLVLQAMNWVLVFLLVCIFYQDSMKKRIGYVATVVVVGVFSEVLTCLILIMVLPDFWINYVFAGYDENTMVLVRMMGGLVGEITVTVWALIYLCLMRKRRWGIFWGFMLIPVYQACLTTGLFRMLGDFTSSVAMTGYGIIFFNLVLDGVVLYLLEGIFKKLDREEELQALEERRRQEYAWYEADSQYVEEMRLIRHDFANQLQTAYSMMDNPENTEKVKGLLKEMREKVGGAE